MKTLEIIATAQQELGWHSASLDVQLIRWYPTSDVPFHDDPQYRKCLVLTDAHDRHSVTIQETNYPTNPIQLTCISAFRPPFRIRVTTAGIGPSYLMPNSNNIPSLKEVEDYLEMHYDDIINYRHNPQS